MVFDSLGLVGFFTSILVALSTTLTKSGLVLVKHMLYGYCESGHVLLCKLGVLLYKLCTYVYIYI